MHGLTAPAPKCVPRSGPVDDSGELPELIAASDRPSDFEDLFKDQFLSLEVQHIEDLPSS